MSELIGALDQGTTSTRFFVFDHEGRELSRHQVEHRQLLERPGWVEHDPEEIWAHSLQATEAALGAAGVTASDLVAIGICNQRETTVVWDRRSGRPLAPAIVWQDVRTAPAVERLIADGHEALIAERTGLPTTTYSSSSKLQWILQHVDGARSGAERGEVLFGTIDSWLAWKLTGEHVTDVTNASRTMLMDLDTLDWDDELLGLFGIPRAMMPRVVASASGAAVAPSARLGDGAVTVPLTGMLGDQQAALLGQGCVAAGGAKCTYGTGNFLLVHTGEQAVRSQHGLITTVAFQADGQRAQFALEGAIAVTGAAVQWLRDQLGIIDSAAACEALAASVQDCEGLYFVPAFSGLFAPRWRADARGVIVGMTRAHHKGHLARAVLEAAAYQTADVVSAVERDLGRPLGELRVDGGMTTNALCMQLQADIAGLPVIRPPSPETTARGAAFAAGLGAGFWERPAALPVEREGAVRWMPGWAAGERAAHRRGWERAVERSLHLAEDAP